MAMPLTRKHLKDGQKPAAIPLYGIGALLDRAARAFTNVMTARLRPHRITIGQWKHLRTLWEEDGLTQVELCRRLGIQKASSTSVLGSLMRRKLVHRLRDSQDKRKFKIYLTAEGRSLRQTLTDIVAGLNRESRKGLAERDVLAFFRVGRAIAENLKPGGRDR